MDTILKALEQFREDAGLSEHRAGFVVCKDGRIFDRLRDGGEVLPRTERKIREGIARERATRGIHEKGAA